MFGALSRRRQLVHQPARVPCVTLVGRPRGTPRSEKAVEVQEMRRKLGRPIRRYGPLHDGIGLAALPSLGDGGAP